MEMKLSLVTTSSPAGTPAADPGAGKRRSNQNSSRQGRQQGGVAIQAAAEQSAARVLGHYMLSCRGSSRRRSAVQAASGQGPL